MTWLALIGSQTWRCEINKIDQLLDAIVLGGMRLVVYWAAALMALIVFVVVFVFAYAIVDAIFGRTGAGVAGGFVIGVVVTVGIAWVLYTLGKNYL